MIGTLRGVLFTLDVKIACHSLLWIDAHSFIFIKNEIIIYCVRLFSNAYQNKTTVHPATMYTDNNSLVY